MRADANMRYGHHEPDHFEIFDQLPTVVRRALAEADYHWQAGWVREYYRITGSAIETVAEIRRADIERHLNVSRKERRPVFHKRGRQLVG